MSGTEMRAMGGGVARRCLRAVAAKAILSCARTLVLRDLARARLPAPPAPPLALCRSATEDSECQGLTDSASSSSADAPLCATPCPPAAAAVLASAMDVLRLIAGERFCAEFVVIARELAEDAFACSQGLDTAGKSDEVVVDLVLRRIGRSGSVETAIDRLFDLAAQWGAGPGPLRDESPDLICLT